MSQIGEHSLYLLDDNISYRFVIPFQALGYDMTSVREVFPKEKLLSMGKKSADDEDIIIWLGKQQSDYGLRGIWITDDWDASKTHAKLILAKSISVFWICDPLHHALKAIQQLQVITMLIEAIDDIYRTGKRKPIYLKGTMDGRRIRLYRLKSHLLAPKLDWEKFKL